MLKQFRAYLLGKGNIDARYVPYYLKWVIACYAFLDAAASTYIGSDQKKQFLAHLAKSHEEWQVKQADTALRFYHYFLSQELKASPETVRASVEWKTLGEKLREALRLRHRAYSTEETYMGWERSFRAFVNDKDPKQLEGRDLQDFLTYLAVEKKVSSSTQNQALNAIVFLYRHVLDKNIDGEISAVRAKQRRRLPVVLTPREVKSLFDQLQGAKRLMAMLIYGCGLRLQEALSMRIKDIDFEQNLIIIRAGKGDKDRRTMLPEVLKDELIHHIAQTRTLYAQDREKNLNGVHLPNALERKYPNAGKEWRWFWLFP